MMVLGGGGAAYAASGSKGGLPQGSEPVQLDPAHFSVDIDNPYWPMSPGSKWVYSETDTKGTNQKVVVEVTGETKMIANGVEAPHRTRHGHRERPAGRDHRRLVRSR